LGLTSWQISTDCGEVEWGDGENEAFEGAVFCAAVGLSKIQAVERCIEQHTSMNQDYFSRAVEHIAPPQI
jgi:hypothetical protein